MIYRITWLFLRAAFTVLFRWRVLGAKKVPREGPVILAGNHASYLDPPVIAVGIWRPGAFLAKEELFHNPLFAWYLRQLGAFPVKRGAGDRAALKHSIDLVEQGRALVLFPEGTRSENGELQEPEMGVGMIAYRTGAPVVPVYVHGTNRALGRKGGLRLERIGVVYGEPLVFVPNPGQKPGREEYDAAARRIMGCIAELRDRHFPVRW